MVWCVALGVRGEIRPAREKTLWPHALEHAGYDPSRFDGAIGVYAGSGHNAYMPLNLLSNPSNLPHSAWANS